MGTVKVVPLAPTLLLLAGCGDAAPQRPARISLDEVRQQSEEPLASPDTAKAAWIVRGDGQAVDFGAKAAAPLLSLECDLRGAPVSVAVVRHAPARPGLTALFPVLGNGGIERFKVDAGLVDGEWRWQAVLPAQDPQLDVFVGQADLEATLPGGGTLAIEGSRVPGEFVTWCRAGGKGERPAEEPKPEPSTARAEPVEVR